MSDVGIIVNPWAGKDVRRLHSNAGHTADSAKVGIVHRAAAAALASGARRVRIATDTAHIAERAARGLHGVQLVEGPGTGSSLDTRRAATQLRESGCGAVVVLGGDGTCRDVVIGWPDAALIPISTGTNNVFPVFVDASSAGTAAGLVARGAVPFTHVTDQAKVLEVELREHGATTTTLALVDVALLTGSDTGARAVVAPQSVRAVVAAIASPASTGLSAIAGRVRPLGRDDEGAVAVRLGCGERQVRVPLLPGRFDVVRVQAVDRLREGESVTLDGPGVLAFDGERDVVLGPTARAQVTVRRNGPFVVDVDRALRCAAASRLFDLEEENRESRHAD